MANENTIRKYNTLNSIKPKRKKVIDNTKITLIKNAYDSIINAIKAKHLA